MNCKKVGVATASPARLFLSKTVGEIRQIQMLTKDMVISVTDIYDKDANLLLIKELEKSGIKAKLFTDFETGGWKIKITEVPENMVGSSDG